MYSLEHILIMNQVQQFKEHIGKYVRHINGDIYKILKVELVNVTCKVAHSNSIKKGTEIQLNVGSSVEFLPEGTEEAIVMLYGGNCDEI